MHKITAIFAGQTIYVGMNVDKDSWNLGIHLSDMFFEKRPSETKSNYHGRLLKKELPQCSL